MPPQRKFIDFLLSALRKGIDTATAAASLLKHGLVDNIRTVFDKARDIAGSIREWMVGARTPREQPLPEEFYREGLKETKSRYLTVFRVEIEDTETGKRSTTYVSVSHDHRVPRRDLEDIARQAVEEEPEAYGVHVRGRAKIISIEPEAGYRRG